MHNQRRRHGLDQVARRHEDAGAFLERRRDQGPDDQADGEGRQEAGDVLLEQCGVDRADTCDCCCQRQRDPQRADHGAPVTQRDVHQRERAPPIGPRRLCKDFLRRGLNSTAPSASGFPILRR